MRRRHASGGDSLELLLDTICNTFGGVVFIAILVVILLQQTDRDARPEPQSEPVSPDRLQDLRNELSRLEADSQSLQKALAGQHRLIERYAPDEVRELIRERNRQQERHAELVRTRNALLEQNAEQSSTIRQTQELIENVRENLTSARRTAGRLDEELQELTESRTRQARMPVLRSPGLKQPVGLILRYGRMYVWHRYGRYGSRLGLNTDEFVVVGEQDGALITTPDPTAGVPLREGEATRDAVAARLEQFDPSDVYITVVARSDSFGEFQYLRDALIELGFQYRLLPMSEGEPVVDRGGTGGRVQ